MGHLQLKMHTNLWNISCVFKTALEHHVPLKKMTKGEKGKSERLSDEVGYNKRMILADVPTRVQINFWEPIYIIYCI